MFYVIIYIIINNIYYYRVLFAILIVSEEAMAEVKNGKINIRGVYFDNVTMDEALDKAVSLINTDGFSYMVTPNSEIVQACIESPTLYDVVNGASLTIPDGIGVVYAANILKTPLKERVPGVELAEKIIEYAANNGEKIYFFGGGKANEERDAVYKIAIEKLQEKYPGFEAVGRDGFFNAEETDDIIADINASGVKILFVCLGAPKQEKWIYDNRKKLTGITFAAGLGGSLDVFAGVAERAPEFYREHNLEWFYRLKKNPSRIGRMMKLPKFLFGTMIHKNKPVK